MFNIDLDRASARVVRLDDGAEAIGVEREVALDQAEEAFTEAITNTGGTVLPFRPRP